MENPGQMALEKESRMKEQLKCYCCNQSIDESEPFVLNDDDPEDVIAFHEKCITPFQLGLDTSAVGHELN